MMNSEKNIFERILGKNVFISHGCTFLDLGGIVIEDDVRGLRGALGAGDIKVSFEINPIE